MASSVISAFVYDDIRNELTVTFTTGRIYVYSLVPAALFAAFEQAGSKGAFFNAEIRDRFPCRRERRRQVPPAVATTID